MDESFSPWPISLQASCHNRWQYFVMAANSLSQALLADAKLIDGASRAKSVRAGIRNIDDLDQTPGADHAVQQM
jgi:hypothetical protein